MYGMMASNDGTSTGSRPVLRSNLSSDLLGESVVKISTSPSMTKNADTSSHQFTPSSLSAEIIAGESSSQQTGFTSTTAAPPNTDSEGYSMPLSKPSAIDRYQLEDGDLEELDAFERYQYVL